MRYAYRFERTCSQNCSGSTASSTNWPTTTSASCPTAVHWASNWMLSAGPVHDGVGSVVQHLPDDLTPQPRVAAALDLRHAVLIDEDVVNRPPTHTVGVVGHGGFAANEQPAAWCVLVHLIAGQQIRMGGQQLLEDLLQFVRCLLLRRQLTRVRQHVDPPRLDPSHTRWCSDHRESARPRAHACTEPATSSPPDRASGTTTSPSLRLTHRDNDSSPRSDEERRGPRPERSTGDADALLNQPVAHLARARRHGE